MNKNNYRKLFDFYARNAMGGEQKPEEIERRLTHLREGAKLAYKDLETIADPACWAFSRYWMWPHKSQIEEKLEDTAGWFARLPNAEEDVIAGLDDIFKNISLVSIVLRFAWPEHYAIYSRPTLRALRLKRGATDTAEYLDYVHEMRILKHCLGMTQTAHVDMMVWAIEHAEGEYLEELKKTMSKVLPENLTAEELMVYLSHDPLRLATEYFERRDFMTAGFWAAKAIEKFLDDECQKNGIHIREGANRRIAMIEALCAHTNLWGKPHCQRLLYDTKETRNKIVPGVRRFSQALVREFITEVRKLKNIAERNRS